MSLEGQQQDESDHEMVPVYIKRFLPALTELFHSSLSQTLRYGNCPRLQGPEYIH